MKSARGILSILVAFLLCMGVFASANAATVTQDGLEVTYVADKESYEQQETVKTTLTIKNTNDFAVSGISINFQIPSGINVAENSQTAMFINTLEAQKSAALPLSFMVDADSVLPETGDNSGILFWLALLICSAVLLLVSQSKIGKRYLSLLLCFAIMSTMFAAMPVANAAADDVKTIVVELKIWVGTQQVIFKVIITYPAPAETPVEIPESPASDFEWRKTSDGKGIILTNYIGTSKKVGIPATIDGLPVVELDGTFFIYHQLTDVSIPDGVTKIVGGTFEKCHYLKNVIIPDSMTIIRCFDECVNLKNVTLPNGLKELSDYAFFRCTSLKSITIPASVTSILPLAFADCTSLTSIQVDPDNTAYVVKDGVLFTKDMKTLVKCPVGKSGAYIIPDGVTQIQQYAFCGCSQLTSVTIPNSVTAIGFEAFRNCTSLESVNIPDGIEYIDIGLFSGCTSLKSISLPDSVTFIEDDAFKDCASLKSIVLPDNAKFYNIAYAFLGCTALTSIEASNNNRYYTTVDGVLFSKDMQTLLAFPGGKSGTYTVPAGVKNLAQFAFSDCSNLTSITFPASLSNIETNTGLLVFTDHSQLTNIQVDSANTAYTSVDGVLFTKDKKTLICYPSGRSGSYTIPDGVTSISTQAFYNCTGLTAITLPSSLADIATDDMGIVEGQFNNCTALANVHVNTENQTFASIDGVLFSKDKKTLVFYPAGKGSTYTIPNSVTHIGYQAFANHPSLTSITIPEGVTSIGAWAFIRCDGLTSVTLPSSVTQLGVCAFFDCANLKTVTIPDSVTRFDETVFQHCFDITLRMNEGCPAETSCRKWHVPFEYNN